LLEDVNKRMRTKQPAALFERKSISHSISKRDFLVVPRGCARFLLSAFFLLIACSAFAQSNSQPGTAKFDGQLWWNYVKVLANDNMEGRDTGSEGLKRAEAYIIEELKADGLQPAGTDGYYQPVKLIARRTLENDSSLALFHDGKSEPLSFETDAYFSNRFSQAPKVDAQLVFVGWHWIFRKRDTAICKAPILRARSPYCSLVVLLLKFPGHFPPTTMLSGSGGRL